MKYLWLSLTVLIMCSFGCESVDQSGNYSQDEVLEMDVPYTQASYEPNATSQTKLTPPKYLIKNAVLDIYVSDFDSAFNEIESIIELNGGYIGQLEFVNNSYETINEIEIKVPSLNLENILRDVEKLATKVKSKEIKTRDVGEEYVDVKTRLVTQEEIRDRYIDVLRNKAKTVEDILKTERQLGQIQEDIEAMKGRLKYLDNRIKMSTLKVTLRKEVKATIVASQSSLFFNRAGNGFSNGWQGILEVVIAFTNLWPLIFILLLLLVFRKKLFAKALRKGHIE